MAENHNSAQERTEQATPKRLQDARKKGDVPRSRELTTSGVMLCAAAALVMLGGRYGADIADVFASGFVIEREQLFDDGVMAESLAQQAWGALRGLLPLLAITVIAAIGFSVALGGLSFSASAMAPKLSKINPLSGLKRMFGPKALVELAKSVAKTALIVTIAVFWLRYIATDLLRLEQLDTEVALVRATQLAALTLLVVSSGLVVGALIDVPWQLYEYARKLRMTRQEVRDEHKETDGRPEVKQRVRQLQQDIATRRMMDSVPYADVIITNPTHFAVALRYDADKMAAPEVVASGKDLIAAQIRKIATEHKVALFSAPPLARALYFSTKIGQPIPAGLYTAVAQVLAYIFQLRDGIAAGRELTPPVPEVDETHYTRGRYRAEEESDQ
ncbi:MAG: flagellar biosynthesis protein FlhB [Pseudomonadota bacterium]